MQHFIFGYGSLINSESRGKTAKSSEALPVRVKGIERAWNIAVPLMGMSAVGAIEQEGATCNGVVFSIDESELPAFDNREIRYRRVEIKRSMGWFSLFTNIDDVPCKSSMISCLTNDKIPEGTIWTYVSKEPQKPSEETPLAQSYIDVILTGCLSFGEDFAREFILATHGWEAPWGNDRLNPRYSRAMREVSLASKIDGLLSELLPSEFSKRK